MDNTENKEVKSKKDLFLDRLKGRYPDKDFANEDDIYEVLNGDYDGFETDQKKRQDADSKISELFTGNPRFAAFFMDTANGDSPAVAFIRHFGKDVLEGTDDEEFVNKLTEEDNAYKGRVEADRKIEEEQKANLENSQVVLDKFQEENELSDDEMNKIIESACNKASAVFMGIFTEETLSSELKAMNHDADVDAAFSDGESKGRNTKINKDKKKTTIPEGMPAVLGGTGAPTDETGGKSKASVEKLDEIINKNYRSAWV